MTILTQMIFLATTTTTTKTTTTTTTATTTTTTNFACGSTCVNTTTSTASWLAFYTFDNTTVDATGTYPATGIPSPNYVSAWVAYGVSFTAANAQRFSVGNIPLNSQSFTIEFWFYATDISVWDYSFMGEYSAQSQDLCLFINIRNQKLFMGFFADDLPGTTILVANRWYHAAFTYNLTSHQQIIYLNGVLDSQIIAANSFLGSSVPFTIGGAEIGGSTSLNVYYSGIIDHVTVSSRVKSACEVYLDANVACYFTFDSSSSVVDSGPNFLTATNNGGIGVTGRVNQALQFISTPCYIAINGISALKSTYSVFSIAMWVNPINITGGATLIHASTQSNGRGSCMAMWGLTSSGVVSVNVIDATNTTIAATASSPLAYSAWTHITQTFSTTNGNRLYINGILVSTISSATGHAIGPYAFIGAPPNGTSYCAAGSISPGQFFGTVDEYRVFGVELTSVDICRLANP